MFSDKEEDQASNPTEPHDESDDDPEEPSNVFQKSKDVAITRARTYKHDQPSRASAFKEDSNIKVTEEV